MHTMSNIKVFIIIILLKIGGSLVSENWFLFYTLSNDFFSKIQAAKKITIPVYTIDRAKAIRYTFISITAVVATRFFKFNDSRLGKNMSTPCAR